MKFSWELQKYKTPPPAITLSEGCLGPLEKPQYVLTMGEPPPSSHPDSCLWALLLGFLSRNDIFFSFQMILPSCLLFVCLNLCLLRAEKEQVIQIDWKVSKHTHTSCVCSVVPNWKRGVGYIWRFRPSGFVSKASAARKTIFNWSNQCTHMWYCLYWAAPIQPCVLYSSSSLGSPLFPNISTQGPLMGNAGDGSWDFLRARYVLCYCLMAHLK